MMPGFLLGLPVWIVIALGLLSRPYGLAFLLGLLLVSPFAAGLAFLREWKDSAMPPMKGIVPALLAPYIALPIIVFGPIVLPLWISRLVRGQVR